MTYPSPSYQLYLREENPNELQPIDEIIYLFFWYNIIKIRDNGMIIENLFIVENVNINIGEIRYNFLIRTYPDEAEKLHKLLEKDVEERYKTYKKMAEE